MRFHQMKCTFSHHAYSRISAKNQSMLQNSITDGYCR